MEIRVAGKYRICKKLGEGSFGQIFSGQNIKSNEEVAIKLERHDVDYSLLAYEASVYNKFKSQPGIP